MTDQLPGISVPSGTAHISPCGLYRYRLTRRWADTPPLGWVMLNPSTADADVDDPTIRRCISFARAHHYGGITVANLFAYRATNPVDLLYVEDPFGPGNLEALEDLFASHPVVMAAWGAKFRDIQQARNRLALTSRLDCIPNHPKMVQAMANRHGAALLCLGTTKDGSPRHPLYVAGDTPAVTWTEAA